MSEIKTLLIERLKNWSRKNVDFKSVTRVSSTVTDKSQPVKYQVALVFSSSLGYSVVLVWSQGESGMTKAVGYIRVSTQGQVRDGYSLAYQLDEIMRYCADNGIELVTVYEDKGISPKTTLKDSRFGNTQKALEHASNLMK